MSNYTEWSVRRVASGLVVSTNDLGHSYPDLLSNVLLEGQAVRPRGQRTVEVRPLTLSMSNPLRCVVRRPGFNRELMFAEIAQVLSGEYAPDLYAAVAPPETVALLTEFGAYGKRLAPQIEPLLRELSRDGVSRRAVLMIPDRVDLDLVGSGRETDQPCTLAIQLLPRDGRLEAVVTMRSWDLVWGLTYDVPVFVSLQAALAAALGLGVGNMTITAGSAHVYERHFDLEVKRRAIGYELPSLWYDDRMSATAWTRTRDEAAHAITAWRSGGAAPAKWERVVRSWREHSAT